MTVYRLRTLPKFRHGDYYLAIDTRAPVFWSEETGSRPMDRAEAAACLRFWRRHGRDELTRHRVAGQDGDQFRQFLR